VSGKTRCGYAVTGAVGVLSVSVKTRCGYAVTGACGVLSVSVKTRCGYASLQLLTSFANISD